MRRLVGVAYLMLALAIVFTACNPYAKAPERDWANAVALLFFAGGGGILRGTRWGLALGLPASIAGVLIGSQALGGLVQVLGKPGEELAVIGFLSAALLLVVCGAVAVALIRALVVP